MKRVFFKRNLKEKIAQLKKEYPDAKEIDYEKDLDWEEMKRQGIRSIINEDRRIEALYKIKEKIDVNDLEMLYGDKKVKNGKISIYPKEFETLSGNIINHSSILVTKNFKLEKDNVLYLKLNINKKDDYVYFRFFDKQNFVFFKKMFNESTLVDINTYFDVYIGNNIIGYALKKGNQVLFDYKIASNYSNNIEVIFDLNDNGIIINNQKFFISQFMINKYIRNNVFTIRLASFNRHKYELYCIEYRTQNINVDEMLFKKDKDILCFKDDLYFYRKEKIEL
ncbi:hypothetical protein [Clostridium brassicae]|uniref:Uncharacterized protein n=1 Tax=Clostridium brassicae TaxID=2999072 RepID=A0ABT4DB83_9CLOT|nr:hypothetical protein [Clostridium brassicae]MCY6959560.1 hypothetical protein [Clostridium brassicae]